MTAASDNELGQAGCKGLAGGSSTPVQSVKGGLTGAKIHNPEQQEILLHPDKP